MMNSLKYRLANSDDCDHIALLHASNWKRHYRGICPDQYLDEEVEEERLSVWRSRFEEEDEKRQILVVEDETRIIAFVCTFLDDHPEFGAYLDNLHVLPEYQGLGIGRQLMIHAAKFVLENRPGSMIYLHVLKDNTDAIQFYERIRGEIVQELDVDLPWGGRGPVIDFAWKPIDLIKDS